MNKIYCGDCLEIMKTFPSESIDMCMTSPPYWGLRDYGTGPDQLGLEPSPEMYIEHLTEIFNEVKRVLKKEGTLWLNMGDTYGGSTQGGGDTGLSKERYRKELLTLIDKPQRKLMPKCLLMIPERLAWSLIQSGWILRNKIVWYKPNAMPSSVTDRFSNKWEYVFMFSKNRKYYFDLDVVREEHKESSIDRLFRGSSNSNKYSGEIYGGNQPSHTMNKPRERIPKEFRPGKKEKEYLEQSIIPSDGSHKLISNQLINLQKNVLAGIGKNPGDHWEIPTQSFSEAHFAVFPEELCIKPIKAGCPEGGIVLDPFCGAGTALYVAKQLRRRFIGIDIKKEYIEMSEKRLAQGVL